MMEKMKGGREPMSGSGFDALVVGSGLAGCTAARVLAERGARVLLLEARDHPGGNVYDCADAAGVLVHRYGPHIFHTDNDRVYEFLSRFTAWRPYIHEVLASVRGRLLPVPFNLYALEEAFPDRAPQLTEKLTRVYGAGKKVAILTLRQSDDPDLRALGDYVYENIFLHYTRKQWGLKPEEIDPAVTARVPVLIGRDRRYFQDRHQGMPAEGYTPMILRMLDHPGIVLRTGADPRALRAADGRLTLYGEPFDGAVVYTGPADELFGCRYGRLPYRTLDFAFETLPVTQFQSRGTINYTVDEDFTRITEFKHLTGQELPGITTIVREYPRACGEKADDIPYYPIQNPENEALYARYAALAAALPGFYLLGRLAQYRYLNMDAVVEQALALCDRLPRPV